MRRIRRHFRHEISSVPLGELIRFCSDFFVAFESDEPMELWENMPVEVDNTSALSIGVFPWTMELMLKEAFGVCPNYGTGYLGDWNKFANSMNHLRDLSNESWGLGEDTLIFHELFRIGHLQFPWQTKLSGRYIGRYLTIYNHPPLSEMIEQQFELSHTAIFRLAFCLYGYFSGSERLLKWPVDTTEIGLTTEEAHKLLVQISTDVESNILHSHASGNLDVNYPYQKSLFEKYPLMRHMTTDGEEYFTCPIPRYLLTRLVDGLYYDLVSRRDFPNPYGIGFQRYIQQLCESIAPERINTLPEAEYNLGRDRKDSLDIILSDETADVLIECKSRRASRNAQVDLSTPHAIDGEMEKLISSIAKTYRNLNDGLNGRYTHWQPSEKPIYLLMVFPKDWFNISHKLQAFVSNGVRDKLVEFGIDPSIRDRVPLITASAESFELLVAVLKARQLNEVCSAKVDRQHNQWELQVFLNRHFRSEIERFASSISDFDEAVAEILT